MVLVCFHTEKNPSELQANQNASLETMWECSACSLARSVWGGSNNSKYRKKMLSSIGEHREFPFISHVNCKCMGASANNHCSLSLQLPFQLFRLVPVYSIIKCSRSEQLQSKNKTSSLYTKSATEKKSVELTHHGHVQLQLLQKSTRNNLFGFHCLFCLFKVMLRQNIWRLGLEVTSREGRWDGCSGLSRATAHFGLRDWEGFVKGYYGNSSQHPLRLAGPADSHKQAMDHYHPLTLNFD